MATSLSELQLGHYLPQEGASLGDLPGAALLALFLSVEDPRDLAALACTSPRLRSVCRQVRASPTWQASLWKGLFSAASSLTPNPDALPPLRARVGRPRQEVLAQRLQVGAFRQAARLLLEWTGRPRAAVGRDLGAFLDTSLEIFENFRKLATCFATAEELAAEMSELAGRKVRPPVARLTCLGRLAALSGAPSGTGVRV